MTLDGTYDNEGKANVLTRIFGGDENVDPEASAVPSATEKWLPFDEWFHGDFVIGWEDNLASATGEKNLEEYEVSIPNYRINTAVEIGFDTNGNSVSGTPEVNMTDPDDSNTPGDMAPITLEGEGTNPFRNEYDHYDDGHGQKLPANVGGPFTKVDENFTVGGVEGVRASIILGGSDPYLERAKAEKVALAALTTGHIPILASQYLLHVATFYSFIDFAYMADGTKVVTVWDASVYPAHALYVDGDWKDENQFRQGLEWVKKGWAWEHPSFAQFGLDAQRVGVTPFDQGGQFGYDYSLFGHHNFEEGHGPHPVLEFEDAGSSLSGDESEFQDPMFPEFA